MVFNHRPTCDAKNRFGLEDDLPLSFEPLRDIYEGETKPQPQPDLIDINNPTTGIVEGDMKEDARDILLRRLEENGVSAVEFGSWLVDTGRPAIMSLSGTAVNSMLENIEVLVNQIKGGNEK